MLETLTSNRADTVRAAVKRVALDQLKAGGPGAVALNAIARELGVSGPALYRYFRNRDALLTALVLDAYDDLADTLARPDSFRARTARGRSPSRTATACCSPRRSRATTPTSPSSVAAAQRTMDLLLPLVDDDLTRAVTLWSRIHGHVSLEIEGNFASMGLDPEALYEAALARAQPATPRGGHCGRRAGRRTSTTATWRTLSQVTWVNAARMPSNATGPTALPGTRRRFAGPPPSGTNRAREPAVEGDPGRRRREGDVGARRAASADRSAATRRGPRRCPRAACRRRAAARSPSIDGCTARSVPRSRSSTRTYCGRRREARP